MSCKRKQLLCSQEQLSSDEFKIFTVEGQQFLVANIDKNYYAVKNECTHQGCPFDMAVLEGASLLCKRHGVVYDLPTGAVLDDSGFVGIASLTCYEVIEEGGEVFVLFD